MRDGGTIGKAVTFWSSFGAIMRFHAVQQRELGDADELSGLLQGEGSELLQAASFEGATVWAGVALLSGGGMSSVEQMKVIQLLEPLLDESDAYSQIAQRLAAGAEELVAQLRLSDEGRDSSAAIISSSVA